MCVITKPEVVFRTPKCRSKCSETALDSERKRYSRNSAILAQGHLKVQVIASMESPHTTSYQCPIVTSGLSARISPINYYFRSGSRPEVVFRTPKCHSNCSETILENYLLITARYKPHTLSLDLEGPPQAKPEVEIWRKPHISISRPRFPIRLRIHLQVYLDVFLPLPGVKFNISPL